MYSDHHKTPSKILVIDDERIPKFEATIVRNSVDAIKNILQYSWDEVWFDFDLSGKDTAANVLYAIEESAFFGKIPDFKKAVIHTSNPVGRKLLEQTLIKWYTVEYADLDRFAI